jgi:SAM-dependent methyltransferase
MKDADTTSSCISKNEPGLFPKRSWEVEINLLFTHSLTGLGNEPARGHPLFIPTSLKTVKRMKPETLLLPNPHSLNQGKCRFCGSELRHTFVDLGMSPPCESYLSKEQLRAVEPFYPLHAYVCDHCLLVQLQDFITPDEIFTEYAYFSSYSDSWLQHAKQYVEAMIERFQLTSQSQVVEIASNDGYLLQYFVERGVPALGIEPAANVAQTAIQKGIPTVVEFFGQETASKQATKGKQADLLLGNNVLAHVPNLNDFVAGMKILLKPQGVITMEFPHLMRLMEENQFDTIYHEHFSYLSLIAVERVFAAHGLTLFDVEELSTHGGSLRIYARHTEDSSKPIGDRIYDLRAREESAGFLDLEHYLNFGEQVKETKRKLLSFLIEAKRAGKTIAGYGAPGKGNTLLNYCGIRTDFLDFTVDRNPYKHHKFLPGTHIPIYSPEQIDLAKPDYVMILPWNLKDEIMKQMAHIRDWGGQFVVPIPEVKVY